jgi:tetratricopeptide (TPR) repeat protein
MMFNFRRIVVGFFFLLTSCVIYAQQPEAANTIQHLLSISDKLSRKGLWKESIEIRQQLLKLNPSDEIKATLLNRIGFDLRYSERYDEAQVYLEQGLQLSIRKKFQKSEAFALYNLGDIAYLKWSYFRTDSVDRAKDLVNGALEIYERIKDPAGISQCLFRLGTILQIQGDSKSSVAAFQRSVMLSRQAKDTLGISRSLTHLAADLQDKNQIDSALFYYEQALALARAQHDNYGRAHYLNNRGEVLMILNRKEEALADFQEALVVSKELDQKIVLCRSYYSLGDFYAKAEEKSKARQYFEEGLKCAEEKEYKNFTTAFKEALNAK